MALYKDPLKIKEYVFKNPTEYRNPMIIFAYAPYCAKHMADPVNGEVYKEILQRFFEESPYTIPFYYVGYMMHSFKNSSAKECKDFLRKTCIDLDRIVTWFKQQDKVYVEDMEYINQIRSIMEDYIKQFIANVRKEQLETGANESVMACYAPVVPYNIEMNKEGIEEYKEPTEYLDAEVIKYYARIFANMKMPRVDNPLIKDLCKESYLGLIAAKNAREIIESIDDIFDWHCPMDMFAGIRDFRYNNSTYKYLSLVWLLNQNPLLSTDELYQQFNDYATFRGHLMSPLKNTEFEKVFKSMCTYKTGDINDMLSVEAWTALQDESQKFADTFLEHASKIEKSDTYDLDALLAEFYTMRHVDTNDYTNQFFLCEYPGIKVNSYSYINDTIMACEINDSYLAIPYVDIAADYKVRMITIDKTGEIKIWDEDDMDELRAVNPIKEKID